MSLDSIENGRKRLDQRRSGMTAKDIGPAEVGFPILKHGPEIDIDDVVALDVANGRVVGCDRQRIRPGPHDALVPVLLHAKLLQGDRVDFLFNFPLGSARPDKFTPLDLVKQGLCPPFGGFQRRPAI
jgi:hypothetical protein